MPDVLIVGAGPVGLTLANDLARRNVDFQIIDALAQPTTHSRAHGMQSRTLESLDVLGLAQPMMQAAQHPQPPMVLLSRKKVLARIDFDAIDHTPYPFPYQVIIWQQRVEQVLERTLASLGHNVQRSTKLVGFDMDAVGVTAHVEREGRPDTIRAAWIVSCEGGRSVVREQLRLPMRGAGLLPGRFLIGEVDLDWNRSGDQIYQWWHASGMAAALYIDFTNKWHVFVEHFGEEIPADAQLERMNALFHERTEECVRISNPAWFSDAAFYNGMPERFVVERAILAGDAAHVHSSAGGQGMNTGIQDALNLGWKLSLAVSGIASPSLVQTYDDERRPNARAVLRASELYRKIQIPQGPIAQWFATALFKAISTIGPLANAVMGRRVGMLGLNYRTSPLSSQRIRRCPRATRAGRRVPDLPCRTSRSALRFFDVIRGTHATLLLFAGRTPDAQVIDTLRKIESLVAGLSKHLHVRYVFATEIDARTAGMIDSDALLDGTEHLQRSFGFAEPEVVYIRPDGYIGLRTQDLDPKALSAYLSRIYNVTSLPR